MHIARRDRVNVLASRLHRPVDIGIVNNFGDPARPILGKTIPITGLVLFLDHTWNERFSSAIGYSRQDNDNREAQSPDAFRRGHYALGNLLYTPVPPLLRRQVDQWAETWITAKS